MASQQFCLKWNNHTNNMLTIFKDLLQMEIFVDCTLACDGLSLKAHKMVLSACSDFFRSLFIENPCKHPVVILKDVSYKDLKAIVDFMYHGEVNVSQDQLSALLKTAETLKVKGLAEVNAENHPSSQQSSVPAQSLPISTPTSSTPLQQGRSQRRADSPQVHARHKRVRTRKRSHSGSDQSDSEVVPMKIKEAHSPEIQEVQDSDISQVSHSSVNIRSSSIHSRSSVTQHEQSYDEGDYDIEPSKLLEQSITSAEAPSMSKAGTSNIQLMGGDSQDLALVPTSDSSQFQELDVSQDIKPEISFDEQSLSPSGYVDQSSLAGPSGYQDNSLVPHDSQSQDSEESNMLKLQGLFLCPHCPYYAKYKTGLKYHILSHTNILPFACSYCSYATKNKGSLKMHLLKHSEDQSIKCHLCSFSTKFPSSLRRHLRIHTGEKPFLCGHCSYRTAKKASLKSHTMIHTGEKPHECHMCEKKFIRSSDLKDHLVSHTCAMPFRCDLCNQKFRTKYSLRKHSDSLNCPKFKVPDD